MRSAAAWGFVLAASLLLNACSAPVATPTPSVTAPPDAAAQRVVYVTPEYEVFTAERDGSALSRLNGGHGAIAVAYRAGQQAQQDAPRYYWPTWSPTGEAVAVSRTSGTEGDAPGALLVLDSNSPSGRTIHQSPPGGAPFIARAAPHYVQWSPDGGSLSFVAVGGGGLRLFVSPVSGEDLDIVASQAPLYHSWAPDSSFLLVHHVEELLRHDIATGKVTGFGRPSLRYRVPAVNHDGSLAAYVAGDEPRGAQLVVTGPGGPAVSAERVLAPLGDGTAAFLWSPTEDVLAFAEAPPGTTVYEDLWLTSPGSEPRQLTSERLAAFF